MLLLAWLFGPTRCVGLLASKESGEREQANQDTKMKPKIIPDVSSIKDGAIHKVSVRPTGLLTSALSKIPPDWLEFIKAFAGVLLTEEWFDYCQLNWLEDLALLDISVCCFHGEHRKVCHYRYALYWFHAYKFNRKLIYFAVDKLRRDTGWSFSHPTLHNKP